MIKPELLLLAYNKDVICVIDKDKSPLCKTITRSNRRSTSGSNISNDMPSHDPYIPRNNVVFYNCSSLECKSVTLESMTQVTSPNLILKSCFLRTSENSECEGIRYNHFKNVDKLLFLTTNINNKTFYSVDCLIYADRGRVCHNKDGVDSYTKLVDMGTMARPNELSVLAQDEFICEEDDNKIVNCDLNPFIPFSDELKVKEAVQYEGDILLKTGTYVVLLTKNCIESWCGYSGRINQTRRSFGRYEPPGGKVYRCYFAKKQQICKELYSKQNKPVYNERGWLSAR